MQELTPSISTPSDLGPVGNGTKLGNLLVFASIPKDFHKSDAGIVIVMDTEHTFPKLIRQCVRELHVQTLKKCVQLDVSATKNRTTNP